MSSRRQPWWRPSRTASASASSFVVTAPPSPVVTILRGWNERQPSAPRPPHARPPLRAPSAPAASSITGTSGSSSRRAGRPNRCTATIAFVLGVTRMRSGSTFIVDGSTSTSTGRAPTSATTFAVAGNVYAGTITSSPGPIPSASAARCSAAVPDDTATACSTSHARATSASSSATFGPIVSCPVPSTSATSASSSAPTSGQARRIRASVPCTTRSSSPALRRGRRAPRSRAARAPSRRSGCAARRPRSAAAGRRARPGSP